MFAEELIAFEKSLYISLWGLSNEDPGHDVEISFMVLVIIVFDL